MNHESAGFDLGLTKPAASGTSLQFYGMFAGPWSMVTVATQIGRSLVEAVDSVGLYSYNGPDYFDPELRRFGHVDHDAPVGVFHGFPSDITAPFWSHPFRVGGFVCESDLIRADWVDVCNRLDLVFVPSTFCLHSFRRSGVTTPIMVVPHGLEPDYRPIRTRQRDRPLRFYNTFHAGSILERKGIEELVGCFLEAFGPSGRTAKLVLRTQLSMQLIDIRQRHDFGAGITLLPLESLPREQFAALYSEFHCTVHPSRGEGFGLVPLQSMACETPVIATAATGMADYLTAENSLPLRTAGSVPADYSGTAAGHYFAIDEDHLVTLLLEMEASWEDHYAAIRRAAPGLRERYSWPVVLEELTEVLTSAATDVDGHDRLRRRLAEKYGPRGGASR